MINNCNTGKYELGTDACSLSLHVCVWLKSFTCRYFSHMENPETDYFTQTLLWTEINVWFRDAVTQLKVSWDASMADLKTDSLQRNCRSLFTHDACGLVSVEVSWISEIGAGKLVNSPVRWHLHTHSCRVLTKSLRVCAGWLKADPGLSLVYDQACLHLMHLCMQSWRLAQGHSSWEEQLETAAENIHSLIWLEFFV